jgi:hypothetical protein
MDKLRAFHARGAQTRRARGLLISCGADGDPQLRFVGMRPDIEQHYSHDDDPLEVR